VKEIAGRRSWKELQDHFVKHLREMERLDAEYYNDRAFDKAWSLLDLCAFAIEKMGIGYTGKDFDFDNMNYGKMLERIAAHEEYLKKLRIEEEIRTAKERRDREQWESDHDTD
jgi:hypothetical protein